MLALQTMDFRRDWERVYEDAVLAEPDIFVETLREFRAGNNHAFEDLWPQIGVLPLELAEFFRSEETLGLAQAEGIERYVSLLESTRSSHGWVKDAMRQSECCDVFCARFGHQCSLVTRRQEKKQPI